MKKFLLLAILVTSSLFAQAQKNKKSPTERAQSRVDKISEELNLTDTQKNKIYDLFLSEGKKGRVDGKNIRDLSKEERQTYINARKEEKAAVYGKIAEILDEDQLATFQAMDKSRKSNPVKAGKGKKNSADRIQSKTDKLTEELALTPEQQIQVKNLLTDQQASHQGKDENRKDWTDEERAAKKAERKAAKSANEEKMKAILSAEQYATYQAKKSAKGGKGHGQKGHKGHGHKGHEGHGHKGKGHDGKGEKGDFVENKVQQLTEKLQLSETQQEQVTTILTKYHDARKANGGKKDLSEEAKEARKADRKVAKTQLDADMKTVLTAEQFATYQQGKKGKGKNKRKGKGKKKNKGKKKGKKIKE